LLDRAIATRHADITAKKPIITKTQLMKNKKFGEKPNVRPPGAVSPTGETI